MDGSASRVGSKGICHLVTSIPLSRLKTYGFAISIIVAIGGLALGATGLAGYFHVGALSNMAQLDAIIMMAAGGGGGTVLLILGILGTVKNRLESEPKRSATIRKSPSAERLETIQSIDTKGGLVYGPEAWKIWNAEVLDVVPKAPEVDLSGQDKILLYIPRKIRVNGKEQNFTLNALKEISGGPFHFFHEKVQKQFGDNMGPGWVLMDKILLLSANKNYQTQKENIEDRACQMISVLEAVALNLMVFAFTEKQLYGAKEFYSISTRCIEKVDDTYPVIVGFAQNGLQVDCNSDYGIMDVGAAAAQRNFCYQ